MDCKGSTECLYLILVMTLGNAHRHRRLNPEEGRKGPRVGGAPRSPKSHSRQWVPESVLSSLQHAVQSKQRLPSSNIHGDMTLESQVSKCDPSPGQVTTCHVQSHNSHYRPRTGTEPWPLCSQPCSVLAQSQNHSSGALAPHSSCLGMSPHHPPPVFAHLSSQRGPQ